MIIKATNADNDRITWPSPSFYFMSESCLRLQRWLMGWSGAKGKSLQVSTWSQLGIYCRSTAPQHICQVNHRPPRTTVPEAWLCIVWERITGNRLGEGTLHSAFWSLIQICSLCHRVVRPGHTRLLWWPPINYCQQNQFMRTNWILTFSELDIVSTHSGLVIPGNKLTLSPPVAKHTVIKAFTRDHCQDWLVVVVDW